jgi:hypothetical protein
MAPGFHVVLFFAPFCALANDLGHVDRYLDEEVWFYQLPAYIL